MKKLSLVILAALCFGLASEATAGFYTWRYREHATDCTALTDGKNTDLCYEIDSDTLYKCEPTAGDCSGAEWKTLTSSPTNINDIGDASGSGAISIGSNTITLSGSGGTFAVTTNTTHTGTLAIPQGTAPVVDAAGEIAVDTTDDQLIYYGGAKRVIPYKFTWCKTIEDPVDADDNITLFALPKAWTATNVYCNTTGSSTPQSAIVLGDGTNSFESITCDDDGATDDGSITNAAFTANEPVEIDFGAPSGTVDWCMVCVSGTVDAA